MRAKRNEFHKHNGGRNFEQPLDPAEPTNMEMVETFSCTDLVGASVHRWALSASRTKNGLWRKGDIRGTTLGHGRNL